jgi:hypothetical protein
MRAENELILYCSAGGQNYSKNDCLTIKFFDTLKIERFDIVMFVCGFCHFQLSDYH